jgi:putative transposase
MAANELRSYRQRMARPPRLQKPGGLYHVTARGIRGEPVYCDDIDRRSFMGLLDRVTQDTGWLCHAYCLLTNHFHLVLGTPEPNLSTGMHRLNSTYASRFNARHGFEGHLFGKRFYSEEVASEWHLLRLVRYVVLNPVRARLCARPGDWRWSSYRALVGLAPVPLFLAADEVLAYFGRTVSEARSSFCVFVAEATAVGGA